MKFDLINCRPVPAPVADEVRAVAADAGVAITSCDRTQEGVNYARSHGCTLSSQAELYQGFIDGRPGFNPANPPGYSTHERRSDGIAFGWIPRGAKLPFAWMVGIDQTNTAAFIAAAKRRGWLATLTYPGNPREGHHVNFRKKPVLNVFRILGVGDKGPRVRHLTGQLSRLRVIGEPGRDTYLGNPRKRFDSNVEKALRRFQEDHKLEADGLYGPHTAKQLRVALRRQKRLSDR